MPAAPGPLDWTEVAVLLPTGWVAALGIGGRTLAVYRCRSSAAETAGDAFASTGCGAPEFALLVAPLVLAGLFVAVRRLLGSSSAALAGLGAAVLALATVEWTGRCLLTTSGFDACGLFAFGPALALAAVLLLLAAGLDGVTFVVARCSLEPLEE